MKRVLLALAVAVSLTGQAFAVLTTNLVNDNFDSYANQAAFEAAWPAIGTTAPLSGTLSTAQASSAPQSIRNPGTNTVNNSSRNQRIFTESETFSSNAAVNLAVGDKLIFSFDFYDSLPTASPQRNHTNLQDGTAPGGTNQLIAMGLNNNQTVANSGGNFYMGRILGYNVDGADVDTLPDADPDGGPTESVAGSGAFFKLNDFGVGLRSLGWHNLKVEISTDDGLSTDYSFFVDNQLAERVSNVSTAANIRSYDVVRLGSGLSNANAEVFYDNVLVQYVAIPEPTAFLFGLLVSSITGLAWCKRQSR